MPDAQSAAAALDVDVYRCKACGASHGARPFRCESCGGDDLVKTAIAGLGRLFTWTVVRRPTDAFAGSGPMTVALVDIDDGPRLTVSLAHTDTEPALGARVRVAEFHNGIPHCTVD